MLYYLYRVSNIQMPYPKAQKYNNPLQQSKHVGFLSNFYVEKYNGKYSLERNNKMKHRIK